WLVKDATKPRALEITREGKKELGIKPKEIPVIGVVTAGQPILAVEDIDDYFPLPPDLKSDAGELFMLKVHGESMINAGILNGDSVIVRKQSSANNGEIVVAMNEENEDTVKSVYKEKDHYRLQQENNNKAYIIKDDSVIETKQSSEKNGKIVVEMTEENEATVKSFYKEKDHYRLQPENDTMAPIILPKVTILGKVVSLYRNNID